jgi:hypothetical protein
LIPQSSAKILDQLCSRLYGLQVDSGPERYSPRWNTLHGYPTEELPDEEASSIATRAEMLAAIAAAEGVPIEVLIQCIHTRVPGKIWSGEEWRRFSAKYSRTVRNL